MSYLIPLRSKQVMKVAIGPFNSKLGLVTGDYLTFGTSEHNDVGLSGTSTETLTLPEGHYVISAVIGLAFSGGYSSTIDAQWELGGNLIGNKGGWMPDQRVGSDVAEAVFSLTSPTALKLKITLVSSSVSVSASTLYTQYFIRKVDL